MIHKSRDPTTAHHFKDLLQLSVILNNNNIGLAVIKDITTSFSRVCRIDTNTKTSTEKPLLHLYYDFVAVLCLLPCKYGSKIRHEPFWRVESENADTMERL